jgi:hypothetical protein
LVTLAPTLTRPSRSSRRRFTIIVIRGKSGDRVEVAGAVKAPSLLGNVSDGDRVDHPIADCTDRGPP